MSLTKILIEAIIDQPKVYHYTHIDNIDSILSQGLRADKKKKNTNYKDVTCDKGVFLTAKIYPDDANIAGHLYQVYMDSYGDDGEIQYPTIARVTIDSQALYGNDKKFVADDDFKYLNKNKDQHSAQESWNQIGSICYTDDIPRSAIEKVEVYIDHHKYKDYKKF